MKLAYLLFVVVQFRFTVKATMESWKKDKEIGLLGMFAKIEKKYCKADSCLNGGTCKETHGAPIGFPSLNSSMGKVFKGHICFCTDEYTGHDCSKFIDPCRNENPCKNGGTCISKGKERNKRDNNFFNIENIVDESKIFNEYTCLCTKCWIAKNCDEPVLECNKDVCNSTRDCKKSRTHCENGTCVCNINYKEFNGYCSTVRSCIKDIECSALNNSVCDDGTCICKPGYSMTDFERCERVTRTRSTNTATTTSSFITTTSVSTTTGPLTTTIPPPECMPPGVIWFGYKGDRTFSKTGKSCLNWNTVTHTDLGFAEKNTLANLVHNECRNPDTDPQGPWCYVRGVVGRVKKEPCFRICSDKICINPEKIWKDQHYRVKNSTHRITISGRPCQRWSSHTHNYTMHWENYCRNPTNDPSGPWCYTRDENVHKEYCHPLCVNLPPDY